jgi:hypothetical protein
MNNQPIDFDAEELQVPFRYRSKDYVLREATGEEVALYRNKARELLNAGEAQIDPTQLSETEFFLLSCCVYERNGKADRKLTVEEVRGLPHRMSQRLYKEAVRVNGLDKASAEKNSQEGAREPNETSDGSASQAGSAAP